MTNEEINALTDPQINVMVTQVDYDLEDGWCLSNDESVFYHCGIAGDQYHTVKVDDYCNDPAVMMPIVFEQKINLISSTGDLWGASWNDGGGKWSIDDYKHHHKNPLRAAAIVYLKMKGVL